MEEKNNVTSTTEKPKAEDLNSLLSINFGPAWSSTDSKTKDVLSEHRPKKKSSNASSNQSSKKSLQDRLKGSIDRNRGSQADSKSNTWDKKKRGHAYALRQNSGKRHSPEQEFFKPVVDVSFQPKEEMFKALVKIMRESSKTFELFNVARTMLQKPERFQVSIRNLKHNADKSDLSKKERLYVSIPDGIPFITEAQAIDHIIANHLDSYFDLETVDTEAPKGNFLFVNRCSITGELLAPPNYHRYKEILKEHHTRHLSHMPYERFVSKIETVKEEEVVQKWIAKMSKGVKFILKVEKIETAEENKEPSELISFDSHDKVRSYLIEHKKSKIIREVGHVKFDAEKLSNMPKNEIYQSVQSVLEQQRRFPLDTANILRERFRHQRFAIYKKGSKGISFVCAIKRKHRTPETVFAESMQKLIQFIEDNPKANRASLPEKHLGKNWSDESSDIATLMRDLHWLITEGYVTEYEDNSLYVSPVQPLSASQSKQSHLKSRKSSKKAKKTEPSKIPINESHTDEKVETVDTISTTKPEEKEPIAVKQDNQDDKTPKIDLSTAKEESPKLEDTKITKNSDPKEKELEPVSISTAEA